MTKLAFTEFRFSITDVGKKVVVKPDICELFACWLFRMVETYLVVFLDKISAAFVVFGEDVDEVVNEITN